MMSQYLITLFLFFGSLFARGEIATSVSYFQYSETQQVNAAAQEPQNKQAVLTSYSYNFQLLMSSRYVVGVNYLVQSSSGGTRTKRETMVPNVGFFYGPLLLEAGPISRSVEKLDTEQEGQWRDATGYYGSVTIYDSWAHWLLVGFQFTFLDIEYRKYFDGITEQTGTTRKLSVLSPALRLSILF